MFLPSNNFTTVLPFNIILSVLRMREIVNVLMANSLQDTRVGNDGSVIKGFEEVLALRNGLP